MTTILSIACLILWLLGMALTASLLAGLAKNDARNDMSSPSLAFGVYLFAAAWPVLGLTVVFGFLLGRGKD